jgi:hypothetical protein
MSAFEGKADIVQTRLLLTHFGSRAHKFAVTHNTADKTMCYGIGEGHVTIEYSWAER